MPVSRQSIAADIVYGSIASNNITININYHAVHESPAHYIGPPLPSEVAMPASGSQIHNTIKDNTFGNISGPFLSTVGDTITHHHYNYPAVPKSLTCHARGYMPVARKKFFGRDQEIKEIVQILTPLSQSKRSPLVQIFTKPASSHRGAHIALLGAGGQGKTEMALQVMAHPTMKKYYGKKNSIWVPCGGATSSELFLHVLFNSLALNQDNKDTLEAILKELRKISKPIILLLDNFETPWNAPGARGAVARTLQDIAQFSLDLSTIHRNSRIFPQMNREKSANFCKSRIQVDPALIFVRLGMSLLRTWENREYIDKYS
ncbi:hypothetical protein C8J56DRAFT_124166 [Mycena floridula]|nr:hypothetical protein C8J56DRAFT_124166 [Mycena floridula]